MRVLVLLVAGLVVGGIGGYVLSEEHGGGRTAHRPPAEETTIVSGLDQSALVAELLAQIERLKKLLAERPEAAAEVTPYPGDTVESVERLLQDAYATTNVDWLLQVIERLLLMEEDGYPILRRLIEDIAFRGKFVPSQQDFRINHAYDAFGIAAKRERQIIGFLNYLLTDPGTIPMFKQFAMMAAAYYVGSDSPHAETLQQTLMEMFLKDGGAGLPASMFGDAGKQMQIFAMAVSGDPRMIEPLRAELRNSKDDRTTESVLSALAYLGDPTVVDAIEPRLDPAKGSHRRELDALGRLGTDRAHEVATDYLRRVSDNDRFYRDASRYLTSGGGLAAVAVIRQRFEQNPSDPSVKRAVGSLRRYPTRESRDTLALIAKQSTDGDVRKQASEAVAEVDRTLRGELPPIAFGSKEKE